MTIAQELRDLADHAKGRGYKATAEILRRMSRDVDAGRLPAIRSELDGIVHAHARSDDALARTWLAAWRIVDGPVVVEPPPPPVYPGGGFRMRWHQNGAVCSCSSAACEETSP